MKSEEWWVMLRVAIERLILKCSRITHHGSRITVHASLCSLALIRSEDHIVANILRVCA